MNVLVQRIVSILKTPKSEWPAIAAEPATIGGLYVPYVLVLAAIGPVATLLGGGSFGMFRLSGGFLLRMAITSYCFSLLSVAVLAWLINMLAPTFNSQRDLTQAFKTAVYASTATWIAGIGGLLGFLGTIVSLAGAVYSVYLLYLGLPHTMKAPPEKSTAYTAVIIVAAILLSIILGMVGGSIMGTRAALLGGLSGGGSSDAVTFDPDSPLGRLERAGREMEQAEKEGRAQDPSQAVGAVMGALAGGGGTYEALPVDTLSGFVPVSLGGLARQSVSTDRGGVLGMQISNAKARYGDGNPELRLEITDTGGAAGLMAFAGWTNIESSSEEGARFESTHRVDGRFVHEEWDGDSKRGEYTQVIGNRFVVKVEGRVENLDALKSAAGEVDLAGLEALKAQGAKPAP